jgi:hypothetical protein
MTRGTIPNRPSKADHYAMIVRAVSSLDRNTREARQALYDRARSALTAELQAHDRPPADAEIARERKSLEDAIQDVEWRDAAQGGSSQSAEARLTEAAEKIYLTNK